MYSFKIISPENFKNLHEFNPVNEPLLVGMNCVKFTVMPFIPI